jgi:hypothetical protein
MAKLFLHETFICLFQEAGVVSIVLQNVRKGKGRIELLP